MEGQLLHRCGAFPSNKDLSSRPSVRSFKFLVSVSLARIIRDGSSRNRQDALRDGHAEARGTKAYLNSTSRSRGTSLPAWPPHTRNQACRSSVLAVAVEVLMNNAG